MLSQDPKGAGLQTGPLGNAVLLIQSDGTICAGGTAATSEDFAAQWTGKSLFDLVPLAERPRVQRLLAAGLEFEVSSLLSLFLDAKAWTAWRVHLVPELRAGQTCVRMLLSNADQGQLASVIDRAAGKPGHGGLAISSTPFAQGWRGQRARAVAATGQ